MKLRRSGYVLIAVTVVTAIVGVAAAPATLATVSGVNFVTLPPNVFEGQRTIFKIQGAPPGKTCTLVIRYKGGRVQHLASRPAVNGYAVWAVRIAAAPPGYATLTASCIGAGRVVGRTLVQWALEAPRLAVLKRGFSQRPDQYDPGSSINFGLSIVNQRFHFDASNIAVLVNFVDATNRVLGSTHLTLARIPASTTIYVGGQVAIPTKTPVVRVEVVFVDATSTPRVPALPPLVSDIILTPTAQAPPYLLSIRGQLLNKFAAPMQGGYIGVLLEDSAGNIVGGGTGFAEGPLSLGAREAFSLNSSFDDIPMANIARTLISVVPNYPTPTP
jgi:hypothetical protein